jgi:hypothetical protein
MIRKLLGGLQIFIGVGGVAGGLPMVLDPTGGLNKMDTGWLAGSPFADFLIPGLFLLLVNGVASIVAGIRSLGRRPHFAEMGIVLGGVLICWITVQVYWIGLTSFLQPLYFGFGALEVALAVKARRATG